MRRSRARASRLLHLALLVLLPAAPAVSQQESHSVPSPAEFLGYALGERFTPSASMQAYARLLASLSPLVDYVSYGSTPEYRDLYQLVLTSSANRLHLDQILAAHAELAEPSTSEARAGEIARSRPAVVYLTYGIHGNEASPGEAALWTAWDLARPASESAYVLDSLVVVIDPIANPDGRDRYVHWYHSVSGATPNPEPQSREHREPWPTGRFNHYLFDLNRDWAWATQPETRARLATWWRWNPLVHVDFHEMGYNSSYFFFPAGAPINPIYPEHVLRWGERFGEANARVFDGRGWPYFTGDEYDLFYPGYGDSWPSLLGAIGMTYEQAGSGSAGLAIRRPGGDTLTLRDRALHHWTAGITTLRTAAAGKTALIRDFAAGQRRVGHGQPDVLLVPGADTLRLTALVKHLRLQGVTVERAALPLRLNATPHPGVRPRREFPVGTHRVRARQARGRLATTLLAPSVPLQTGASYDISAWSLPYAYGVEAYHASSAPEAGWTTPIVAGTPRVATPSAGYGYLIPGTLSAGPGVIDLMKRGGRVRVLSRPASIGGRDWPEGTWFVPMRGNDSVRARMDTAGLAGLSVPVHSGRAQGGIDLGSEHVWPVMLPRIGVLSGEGVSPSSFGAQWHYLEQELGLPFDALLLQDLSLLDVSAHQVLVIPDLPAGTMEVGQLGRLREWVSGGGRLIAIGGGAAAVAAAFDFPLRRSAVHDSVPRERLVQTRRQRRRLERESEVTGVILPVNVDAAHPLGWGSPAADADLPTHVLHGGTLVFDPATDVETVAYFPDEVAPVSGVISDENLRRLEHGAWLVSRSFDRGSVILFADDPLFRLFWRQTHQFYLNSLLVGSRR